MPAPGSPRPRVRQSVSASTGLAAGSAGRLRVALVSFLNRWGRATDIIVKLHRVPMLIPWKTVCKASGAWFMPSLLVL